MQISRSALPAGIAYGWFTFPHGANDRYYKHYYVGGTIALIPERDWFRVPIGSGLLTIKGNSWIKTSARMHLVGNARIIDNIPPKNGYFAVGFYLGHTDDATMDEPPVRHCLRCGSANLVKEKLSSMSLTSHERHLAVDRVMCQHCEFWWEEPFVASLIDESTT